MKEMINIKIRNVKIDDFNDILKLQLQLENAESILDENLKMNCYATDKGKEKLRNRIYNKNNIVLVVENEKEQVIAFIDGNVPDDEWWYKEKVAYINHLCVDESYRNKGIATKLLYQFEILAKKKDAKYIRLLAFPNNKPAVTCYRKNDFIEYSAYYQKTIL